jgi:hypothetical protein
MSDYDADAALPATKPTCVADLDRLVHAQVHNRGTAHMPDPRSDEPRPLCGRLSASQGTTWQDKSSTAFTGDPDVWLSLCTFCLIAYEARSMTADEPRVSDRDGTRVVIDATGDELVCRRKTSSARDKYHRIDCDRLAQNGTIHPACRVRGVNDTNWEPITRATIDRTWDGCQYQQCYSHDDDHDQQATDNSLQATLAEMSVAEFDAAVAAHNGDE